MPVTGMMFNSYREIVIQKFSRFWKLWAKSLGEKATQSKHESDVVALIRTVIFISYLTTNLFIISGVIRHWNDNHEVPGNLSKTKKENVF